MHARSPRARRHHAVRLPDVLHLFVFQRLSLQHVAVLHGNLPVEVGAHLVGQLGQGEQSPKHGVHVLVALGGDLEVRARVVSGYKLIDLLLLHLSVELSVAFVPADYKRNVDVLFDLVFEARLGLEDLPLEPLNLLEGVSVVQAENEDEDVAWREGGDALLSSQCVEKIQVF